MSQRISLEWLRDLLDFDEPADRLAEMLTLSGTEVEQVIRLGTGWDGVVVARIVELAAVPGSDHLKAAQLDVGGRQVQVVSGAPNLRVGSLVPFAPPGTTLPVGMTIKERKMLGVASSGMICSADELGIPGDRDGIMDLGSVGETGGALSQLIPPDEVLVVEVTANRPDELCHLGIARELSALLDRPLREGAPKLAVSTEAASVAVEIRDPDLCWRYVARTVDGIGVGHSPAWIQRRLRAVGQRPINNVVDAANYVLLELGQPLHTFDRDRLRGDSIVVRRAAAGETIECLDGKTRELDDRTLVIADRDHAEAIAGIIGGMASAVTTGTTRVAVESATFLGTSIRATSRRLGLRTEASSRFEKQIHPALAPVAADRLCELLQEVAGAGAASPAVDVYPRPVEPAVIRVSEGYVAAVLGDTLPPGTVKESLRRLHFDVTSKGNEMAVTAPVYRLDIGLAVDLVEEVGRLRGYAGLPSTLPGRSHPVGRLLSPPDLEWTARDVALGAGFDEIIGWSFVGPGDPEALGVFPSRRLALANPMSSAHDSMRTTLLPGLARNVAHNLALGNADIRVFELGRVFWPEVGQDLPNEARVLGLAIHVPPGDDPRAALLELKGAVTLLAHAVSSVSLEEEQVDVAGMAPGRGLRLAVGGKPVGCLGLLADDLTAMTEIVGGLALAEVNFDILAANPRLPRFTPIDRYPGVVRDLALDLPAQATAADVLAAIRETAGVILRSVDLYDEYRGRQLVQGRKGLTFHLVFGDPARTLTSEEVGAAERRVVEVLGSRLDGRLR